MHGISNLCATKPSMTRYTHQNALFLLLPLWISLALPFVSDAPCPVKHRDDALLCELSLSTLWRLCELCKVCPDSSDTTDGQMFLFLVQILSELPKSSISRLALDAALNNFRSNASDSAGSYCTKGECTAFVAQDERSPLSISNAGTTVCNPHHAHVKDTCFNTPGALTRTQRCSG
jgi:hypothetical protein